MSLRRIDLNLLTVFDAIITERNLTRAAERIGMSQPAMSNALSRLRTLVGDDLFVREGRGIRPTARALEMAPTVHQALEMIEESITQTGRFDPAEAHTFTIAGFDYDDAVILPSLVGNLAQEAPGVRINVLYGTIADQAEKLRYGDTDIVIDYLPHPSEDYVSDTLLNETLVAVVRSDHPDIDSSLTLKQYLSHQHVILQARPSELSEVDRYLHSLKKRRRIAVEVTNLYAGVMVVEQSNLIATLPRIMAEKLARGFNVKIVPLPIPHDPAPIYMIWHRSQAHNAAHCWLRDRLRQICDKLQSK